MLDTPFRDNTAPFFFFGINCPSLSYRRATMLETRVVRFPADHFRFSLLCFSLFMVVPIARGDSVPSTFRVLPYVQNPTPRSIEILWFSTDQEPGTLVFNRGDTSLRCVSTPVQATALVHSPFGEEPGGPHPAAPWQHRVVLGGLSPGMVCTYSVRQGTAKHTATFRTSPTRDAAVRFLVYADSETEPESSTVPPVDWPVGPGSNRPEGITKYLVDQTTGYRENLKVMQTRQPDFVLVTGDLVEAGGEQRDWDEFWKHNAGEYGHLASSVPLFAALGNHENYGGPGPFGGYKADAANFGTAKFLTYFSVPHNGAANPKHTGRYYRIDYGPIAVISVDSSDGLPVNTAQDTNHSLADSHAPDFNPGSPQFVWLERQLADAQKSARFTFVQYHHTAYGSGPHSVPFGTEGFSGQSGRALRVLEPLFHKYGVDAVFSGHDEMLERSSSKGLETLPSGTSRAREIPYYDAGIGGDGLRGPSPNFDNPIRKFLAHDDAPEVWNGRQLVSGGKHYGHLEVNVIPPAKPDSPWTTTIVPVHVFPLNDAEGRVTGFERREYADRVTLVE
jgi:3',5'-cyclic AMP phosphodiesterase CpdA